MTVIRRLACLVLRHRWSAWITVSGRDGCWSDRYCHRCGKTGRVRAGLVWVDELLRSLPPLGASLLGNDALPPGEHSAIEWAADDAWQRKS